MKLTCIALLVTISFRLAAQTIPPTDSSVTLQNIIVSAYENNAKLIDVPAAISVVSKTDLNRFNNSTILSAMNLNPLSSFTLWR